MIFLHSSDQYRLLLKLVAVSDQRPTWDAARLARRVATAGLRPSGCVHVRMVGRDKEAEIILEEYEQAAAGSFRSLCLSGLPGIGKTRLVQELQKPMVKHRGYFTSGKFDVYQKNIPHSSLVQAFRNLIRSFLTESDERVAVWKDRVLKALGKNGKAMTDVIPELEVLLGPQPEVQTLPPGAGVISRGGVQRFRAQGSRV